MTKTFSTEIKMYILQNECDSMNRNGFDTDLSRYYELFREGRKDDAKRLYKNKLSLKYPDEEKRVELLRSYRTKDPDFAFVYGQAVNDLVYRLINQISKHVDGIISCFDGIGSNPMSVLKATQTALRRFFPSNIDHAFSMIRRLESYVVKMEYRVDEFYDIADLLKGYLDNSIFHSDEELKAAREEQKKEIMEKLEKKELEKVEGKRKKRKRYVIDLNKVNFTKEDLAEIRIDAKLQRKALKVLAYCRLYWTKVQDPDFERKIFLYSKKYNTNHFDIYQTIKYNRHRKAADDVILLEVFNRLSKGYDYSISEDTFMRQAWQRIKPAQVMSAPVPVKRRIKLTAPSASPRRTRALERPKAAERRPAAPASTVPKPQDPKLKPATEKPQLPAAPPKEQVSRRSLDRPSAAAPKKPPQPEPTAEQIKPRPHTPPEPKKRQPKTTDDRKAKGDSADTKSDRRSEKPERRKTPVAAKTVSLPDKPSLHEQVAQFKGGLFTNYHRLFKAKLVSFIEEYLIRDALSLRHKKMEEANLEEAKGIIHRFIIDHYDDAEFDWIGSDDRKKVEEIGFLVTELFTITTRCYNQMKDRYVSEEYKRMSRR